MFPRLPRRLLGLAAIFVAAPLAFGQKPTIPWDQMDLGPFQTGCFKVQDQIVAKGIAIKVGTPENPATVLFDPELMRMSAAWTGGFLKWPRNRGGLEGQIAPDGDVRLTTNYLIGWGAGAIADDPRPEHQGNLPRPTAKWSGLYVHGDKVVLSYMVGSTPVLEMPGYDAGSRVFTRTFALPKTAGALTLLLAELAGGSGTATDATATVFSGDAKAIVAGVTGAPVGTKFTVENGRIALNLPPQPTPVTFRVGIWSGDKTETPEKLVELASPNPGELDALTKGGPARWGAPLETQGKLGTDGEPYVVDDIPLPEPNPFNSWIRPGGHDFFPNGDAALVNLSGDVWLVGGLDERLASVKWKRIATGLFQPLGCKVVDGKVYVLGRDQITRLHDLNGDGETDFYENFNNDCVVTDNYHEFALDLQTDSAGNFYYAKGSPWTPTNRSPHQGTMLRVSTDGAKLEIIATGLRAPNGLAIGPNDFLTCSDNQGHWMPANRLNAIRPGGFYGMTPAAHKTLRFKAADGAEFEANPSAEADRDKFKTEFWGKTETPKPMQGYDVPLVWMPQNVDNSPGGEVWVSGGKWGPWEGRMLHLSYGHCVLYGVAFETVEGVQQGAVIKFPFKFPSGIMRGRFHPLDGQLYVSGLNVWQSDAAKFGCFSRVRYTGKPVTMPVELHVKPEGVELKFSGALDEPSATDPENFSVERWNYEWTGAYGSPDFKVSSPREKGKEPVLVESITISPDKKTLLLKMPDLGPCMQMRVKFKINSADGGAVDQEIHNTIHRVPGKSTAAE